MTEELKEAYARALRPLTPSGYVAVVRVDGSGDPLTTKVSVTFEKSVDRRLTAERRFAPVRIEGEPLSDTILDDRR